MRVKASLPYYPHCPHPLPHTRPLVCIFLTLWNKYLSTIYTHTHARTHAHTHTHTNSTLIRHAVSPSPRILFSLYLCLFRLSKTASFFKFQMTDISKYPQCPVGRQRKKACSLSCSWLPPDMTVSDQFFCQRTDSCHGMRTHLRVGWALSYIFSKLEPQSWHAACLLGRWDTVMPSWSLTWLSTPALASGHTLATQG